ncbi:hypothetical protein LJC17_00995 [Acholeplasma sp. OttesenSCG-928-E16]|nr:hypothetical protein [Acholeplasma sp. OttesenSCG-928-E16]
MTKEQIIFLIIGIVLFVVFIIFLLMFIISRNKKEDTVIIPSYVDKLFDYLGGNTNIKEFTLSNKRLGVIVNDIKSINQDGFKELGISAFLKGNELKILVKDEPELVYQLLTKKHKGE